MPTQFPQAEKRSAASQAPPPPSSTRAGAEPPAAATHCSVSSADAGTEPAAAAAAAAAVTAAGRAAGQAQSLAEFRRFDPFRKPAWRWLAAERRFRDGRRRLPRGEDPKVVAALRYLRALAASNARGRPVAAPGGLAEAHAIHLAGGHRRDVLEARLLAGESSAVIASKSCVGSDATHGAQVVDAYADYFFDVRPNLGADAWLLTEAVGIWPGLRRPLTDRDVLCYLAVAGGPLLLDFVLVNPAGAAEPDDGRALKLARFLVREYVADWRFADDVTAELTEQYRAFTTGRDRPRRRPRENGAGSGGASGTASQAAQRTAQRRMLKIYLTTLRSRYGRPPRAAGTATSVNGTPRGAAAGVAMPGSRDHARPRGRRKATQAPGLGDRGKPSGPDGPSASGSKSGRRAVDRGDPQADPPTGVRADAEAELADGSMVKDEAAMAAT
jgi:hypothetical protein